MIRFAIAVFTVALSNLPHPAADAQSGAPTVQGAGFVYITGEVSKPGKFPLVGTMRVAQALALSGGLLPSADRQRLLIVDGTLNDKDGNPITRTVSYRDLMNGKDLAKNNVKLGSDDVLIVRSASPGR